MFREVEIWWLTDNHILTGIENIVIILTPAPNEDENVFRSNHFF